MSLESLDKIIPPILTIDFVSTEAHYSDLTVKILLAIV